MSKGKIETLNNFCRERLSRSFFMRDFLYSETAVSLGLSNFPNDKDLAIKAGKGLCENILEPLQSAWGRIHIRSAYRSEEVNQAGNELGANCAINEKNYAGHIWDRRDAQGYCGATACVVIPAYLDYYESTGDWASLAWWIHHHIPAYNSMYFFPNLCAFNINWIENISAEQTIKSYIKDINTGSSKAILNKGQVSDFYQALLPEQRYSKCLELINE
jgi:hypothetical protein